ncbi:translation initiation factor IF-2 [Desulfobacterota bacterium M19]
MKVRVYELAREVGMDSKLLAVKLKGYGYDVTTHSSSLDEATAAEIRKRLSATHTEVQEKRIQTKGHKTIIRRRTKAVKPPVLDEIELPEPPPPVVEPEAEISKAASPGPEVKTDKTAPQPEAAVELPVDQEEKTEAPAVESRTDPSVVTVSEKLETVTEPETASAPGAEVPAVESAEQDEAVPLEDIKAEEEKKSESKATDITPVQHKEKPQPVAASRKGLARVIKRAAIKLPVEEERPRPKKNKPRGSKTTARPPHKNISGAARPFNGGPGNDHNSAPGKGKRGKRFVKFHHEPGAKAKRGRKQGYGVVDMEDVAMAGGRLSSALKLDRQRRGGKKMARGGGSEAGEAKAIKRRIQIYDTISIGDLAHRMGIKANELIVKLMGMGVMATVNQIIDLDTAVLVAAEFGYDVEQAMTEELNILNLEDNEAGGEMLPRPPVVTVMGHVDHGKTSILDAIRNSDVAAGEAGGITQHIGAHYVRSPQGEVVFLDTPGHAAFTEMRSRGAQVTDIVVLVVAADDGVMDQTKEAINHAKAAEVPIVVAINKIDKDDADPMRVKRELAEYDLVPEDWGGSTIFCEVSAKQNIGINELLEQILLQSEILELKADPKRRARGRVVEAKLHRGLGAVATILIQQGTLRDGDAFVVGEFYGKVRSMFNDKGETVPESGPSMPVEVHGLSGVPSAGDEFIVMPDEKTAKNISSQRQTKSREKYLAQGSKISLENLFEKLQEGAMKELCVLLRADVQGTLEAFAKTLKKLSTKEIKLSIIHEGTGTITESDVLLASASDAIILGFNVRPNAKVQEMAKKENVDIRFYDVIYHAVDDITKAMTGMLDPTFEERVIGTLEVRQIFSVPKIGVIAGSYVTDGKITRNARVRLLRDGVVVYTGNISSLRRFKDDAKEVASGYECGVGIENYNDIKVGDTMEAFVMDEVEATL